MNLCLINVTRFKPVDNVEILAQQDGPTASSARMEVEGVVPLEDGFFTFIKTAERYYNEEMGLDVVRHRDFGYLEYNYTTEKATFGQIYSVDPISESVVVLQCSPTSGVCVVAYYKTSAPWKMLELQTYDIRRKRLINKTAFKDDEGFLQDDFWNVLQGTKEIAIENTYKFSQKAGTIYLKTTNEVRSVSKVHKVNLANGEIGETSAKEFDNPSLEYSTNSLFVDAFERSVPFLYDDRYTKRTNWPKGITVLTEAIRSCFTGSSTDYVYRYSLLLQDKPVASLKCYMCSLLYIDQHKDNIYYLVRLDGRTYLLRSNIAN